MTCDYSVFPLKCKLLYILLDTMLRSRLAHGAIVSRRQGLIRAGSIVCEVNNCRYPTFVVSFPHLPGVVGHVTISKFCSVSVVGHFTYAFYIPQTVYGLF